MPIVKPNDQKAISTLSQQPQKMSERYKLMALMEIGGASGVDMAKAVGISQARVSIIRNSPMYKTTLEIKRTQLEAQIMEKHTEIAVGADPVERVLKGAALEAAGKVIDLMRNAESEFVRSQKASEVLDRAGYKDKVKTKRVIEVTEKMADRFEKVLRMPNEHTGDARSTTVRIEEEVSS